MSQQFQYSTLSYQIHFGLGQLLKVPDLLPNQQPVFIIASTRTAKEVEKLIEKIGKQYCTWFDQVVQHVPIALVDEAEVAFVNSGSKHIVAIGGGSAIGLAKAISLRQQAEIIAATTTYSGSEMTNIWGITGTDGNKTTGRDDRVMAKHVIYDLNLTATLPKDLAYTSGVNALAHLVEAAYSPTTNPVTYNASIYGIKLLMSALQQMENETVLSPEVNELLLEGAFLAGKSLSEVTMSLHHKTAHVIGGSFGLEHSHVHTVLLPFVLDYQWPALSKQLQQDLQESTAHTFPPLAILERHRRNNAPSSLQDVGYKKEDISKTVELLLQRPYKNIRPLHPEDLQTMLTQAYYGKLVQED